MKVVRFNQLLGTERDVNFTGGHSVRGLIMDDKMGFGICKTYIPKSETPHHWHYPEHLEACYCIKGKGILKDLTSGVEHLITPDVMYVLDNHDDHTFHPLEDTILISIFNPPLVGDEYHDENGQYRIKK